MEMSPSPRVALDDMVRWLIGREVEAAGLFLNSLRLSIDGYFGANTGMFLWFDPVWHLGSYRGVLVGSRQAQAEESDAQGAMNQLVQELVGKRIEGVAVEALTNDIDVRFSGGYWVRTFVSDPESDYNWYFRDRRIDLSVYGSAKGLRFRNSAPASQDKAL